ncbi:MAG TPA: hypothetical protein VJ927_08650 [Actinomycetota bacterium]|nr:hypothetical protein [Actinomycetota bacterium]
MGDASRWQQRSKVNEVLAEELPAMQAALETTAFEENVKGVLEDCAEGELVDWVTVAVHRLPDGSTTTSICGPSGRTDLQIKGLLHDAIWTAAHNA